MQPLPACQRITARLIWRSTRWTIVRMSWVRTCSGTGQILRLARGLAIWLAVAGRRERLPVGAVHGGWLSDTAPDCVCRNKCLSLSRYWGEDAVLVEPHAVGAAAVLSRLEARAADLVKVSRQSRVNCMGRGVPCDVCSSDRQWQCAGEGLAAGGAAGRIAAAAVAAGDMGLVEEERESTHWDLAGGMAAGAGAGAGAGTGDVEPCRDGALGWAEEGAWCSSGWTSSVSELSDSLREGT
jgi:hypothetical protein